MADEEIRTRCAIRIARYFATLPFFNLDAITVNNASASAQHVAAPSVPNRTPDAGRGLAASIRVRGKDEVCKRLPKHY